LPEVALKKKAKLTVVNARLFSADVEELKRRAVNLGFLAWQPVLRKLVHDALKERRIVR